MHGVVLAGTLDWGRTPWERLRPRALLPVGNSPLAAFSLRALRNAGVREVTICGGSDTADLCRVFGDGAAYGMQLDYYEDRAPRGAAGCVRDAVAGSSAARVVVLEASVVHPGDIAEQLLTQDDSHTSVTLAGTRPDTRRGGWTPAGAHLIDAAVLDAVQEIGFDDLKEALMPRLAENGERVRVHDSCIPAKRVWSLSSYYDANSSFLKRLPRGNSDWAGYRRVEDAWIHHTARVSAEARLIGCVMIGPHTHVGAGALLAGPVVVGPHCVIGDGAAVCRSILWSSCRVRADAFHDSIVMAGDAWYEIPRVDVDEVEEKRPVPVRGGGQGSGRVRDTNVPVER